MGEGGQKVQTSSYKAVSPGMYVQHGDWSPRYCFGCSKVVRE